jgi:hypothetical protein
MLCHYRCHPTGCTGAALTSTLYMICYAYRKGLQLSKCNLLEPAAVTASILRSLQVACGQCHCLKQPAGLLPRLCM